MPGDLRQSSNPTPIRSVGRRRDIAELRATLAADFARSANPSFEQRLALLVFRVGQYVHTRGSRGLLFWTWRLADLLYLRWILGADLAPNIKVGPGLGIPHAARGVVIHGDVEIGANSMIFHGVTIGPDGDEGAPHLGDDAYVAPGACIIGPVRLGSRVRVGANAVVVGDVPDGTIVFGVPGRMLTGDAPKAR